MTTYAHVPITGEIVASWAAGSHHTAHVVTRVANPDDAQALSRLLTWLSEELWKLYEAPAEAFGDPEQVNTHAWRLAEQRQSVAGVLEALTSPQRADLLSYIPVEEYAHRIGRRLKGLDSDKVIRDIYNEVATEVAALEKAEAGQLEGRASQALNLTRLHVSPTLVEAAHTIIAADPLNALQGLREHVDPTSSCIAAAGWLLEAARIAGGPHPTAWLHVVQAADDIYALAWETPTSVLRQLADGESDDEVVLGFLRQALAARAGDIAAPGALLKELKKAKKSRRDYGGSWDDWAPKLSLVDPRRPAPDMLEDLIAGIEACFVVWQQDHYDDVARLPELDQASALAEAFCAELLDSMDEDYDAA